MAYNLVDVSNLLYIGNTGAFRDFSVQDINGREIPTGGIYALMNLFRSRNYNFLDDYWIFCFDRKSFRSELSSITGVGYRGQRTGMPQFQRVQGKELEQALSGAGFNVQAFDGLEADDVIATIALALKGTGEQVNIISSDRDFAYLVDDFTNVISPNPRVPSVHKWNYNQVAGKRGHTVFYNTSLLYKILCGDTSDNIPSVSRQAYAYYKNLCHNMSVQGLDYTSLSDFELLDYIVTVLPDGIRQRAEDNWQFIKPRIIDDSMLDFKEQNINREALAKFLDTYAMKSISKKFKIDAGTTDHKEIMRERLRIYAEMFSESEDITAGEEVPIEEQPLSAIEAIKVINGEERQMVNLPLNPSLPDNSVSHPTKHSQPSLIEDYKNGILSFWDSITWCLQKVKVVGEYLDALGGTGVILEKVSDKRFTQFKVPSNSEDTYSNHEKYDKNWAVDLESTPNIFEEKERVNTGNPDADVVSVLSMKAGMEVHLNDSFRKVVEIISTPAGVNLHVLKPKDNNAEMYSFPLHQKLFVKRESNTPTISTDFRDID